MVKKVIKSKRIKTAAFWDMKTCRPANGYQGLRENFFPCNAGALRGPWPPHSWCFKISHNDAVQLVGLLWTSDQLVAETSIWQHTTLTTDRHPCPRLDSNPSERPQTCALDRSATGTGLRENLFVWIESIRWPWSQSLVASESQSAKQAWGSIFSSVEYCVIILEDRNRFSHMHKTNFNYTYRCAYFNLHISWADRKTNDSPLNNSKHFPNFSALNVLWFVSVNPTDFNFPFSRRIIYMALCHHVVLHSGLRSCISLSLNRLHYEH